MSRILSIVLLAFNGIGALIGGLLLIADPTGWKLRLPLRLLQHSPFDNYLIPGIILFVVIGLGSLSVSALVIMRVRNSASWVILSGFTLAVWISIQILMIREVSTLQILYAMIGILLMILGIIERRKELDN